MTLVDRFVCRREGHIPAVRMNTVTWASKTGPEIELVANTCQRCGRIYDPRVEKEERKP